MISVASSVLGPVTWSPTVGVKQRSKPEAKEELETVINIGKGCQGQRVLLFLCARTG